MVNEAKLRLCALFCFFYLKNFVLRSCLKMGSALKEGRRPSESFVIGVAAVVFLIIGYQTALFVHNAAVLKIAADRDSPDTVLVYVDRSSHERVSNTDYEGHGIRNGTGRVVKTEKVVPKRPAVVEAVRKSTPRRRVESFVFDPNTASEDDLMRLGFSAGQAESIVNYRQKGGRFRRKADFARSFVVSDSIFRRLEPYIDIPLVDLNHADSTAFDALPGIGGWFAKKMIEYRKALGGYSCAEQLMDIYRFDQEKYDALKDLVTVSDPYHYPLWELPADSLRRHPYIRNYETARAIVIFRETASPEDRTLENLASAGIVSQEQYERLVRCLSANNQESPSNADM